MACHLGIDYVAQSPGSEERRGHDNQPLQNTTGIPTVSTALKFENEWPEKDGAGAGVPSRFCKWQLSESGVTMRLGTSPSAMEAEQQRNARAHTPSLETRSRLLLS